MICSARTKNMVNFYKLSKTEKYIKRGGPSTLIGATGIHLNEK